MANSGESEGSACNLQCLGNVTRMYIYNLRMCGKHFTLMLRSVSG